MQALRQALSEPIVRLYAATAGVLGVLLLAALQWWSSEGGSVYVLPWYLATIEGLSLLAGISIAFLCLGRYQAVRDLASLLVGGAFLANGALTLLYILSWPGLVSYGGVLTDNPNTAHWLYLLKWSTLAVGLLVAALVGSRQVRHQVLWTAAAGGLVVLAGALVILFEDRLALLEQRGRWTSYGELWAAALALLFLAGSLVTLWRYRRDHDYLLGYTAVVQLVAVFIMLEALVGARRYDAWWYAGRTLLIGGYLVLLVGLLSEYAALYRRERDRAQEARRALAESEALRQIAQEVAGQSPAREVMALVVEQARALLGADRAGVLVLAEEGEDSWHVPGASNGVAGLAPATAAEIVTLVPGPRESAPAPDLGQLHAAAVRALAGADARLVCVVPLVAAGQSYGALVLGYRASRPLLEEDRRFAAALAGQAAVALEQARARRDAAQAEAAREADRLKSELLATVSHELRTPLGAIKGHATTLARFGPRLRSTQRREFLEAIDRASDRLAELIDNLLLVQRMDAGGLPIDLERVALDQLVAEVVAETAARAPAHQVCAAVSAGLPPVRGDPRRVRQVLTNLVDNAIKYSPAGGEIWVAAEPHDEAVLVSVRDQGLGIPAAHLAQVFERFHRVDSERTRTIRGTGLGLAICRAIVTAHAGRIWAESAGEGCGSTFRFTLPRWEGA